MGWLLGWTRYLESGTPAEQRRWNKCLCVPRCIRLVGRQPQYLYILHSLKCYSIVHLSQSQLQSRFFPRIKFSCINASGSRCRTVTISFVSLDGRLILTSLPLHAMHVAHIQCTVLTYQPFASSEFTLGVCFQTFSTVLIPLSPSPPTTLCIRRSTAYRRCSGNS